MALVVGRTRVNVWECDEIGHVNVRFYGEKLDQGLPVFLHHLGLTPARLADEGLSVAVTAHHVRYIRELTGGDNLLLEVQVIALGEDTLRLAVMLRPVAEAPLSAVYHTDLVLQSESPIRRPKWPADVRDKALALQADLPPEAAPRSLSPDDPPAAGNLQEAERLRMKEVFLSPPRPIDLDAAGRFKSSAFFGCLSDSVEPYLTDLPRYVSGSVGIVVLEGQVAIAQLPAIGAPMTIRSAFTGATDKLIKLTYWVLDLETGAPLAAARSLAAMIDMDARKLVALPAEALAMVAPEADSAV